jgi:pimeloyl-ACP methyl ester carboxylesterase
MRVVTPSQQRDDVKGQIMSDLPSAFRSPRGETEYMAAYEATMRLWPVQYESVDIPSRFGSTHLVVCGPRDAPPLVLLHCFFTSLAVWAYNILDLSRDYRVYALDMMGQPSKSIPDQPIGTREEMAEWLTAILDLLRISKTDLAGYSYGGFAALNYAMRASDRINKLVLLSPVGGLVPPKAQFYIRGMLSSVLHSFSRFTTNILWFDWFVYQPNLKNESTRRMFDCLSKQFALGLKHFRLGPTVLPLACSDEELRSVRTPTLLLIGQQEALYDPVAAVARAKQLIPDIRTDLIPLASHDLPVSQSKTVNRRVLEFLKERGNE